MLLNKLPNHDDILGLFLKNESTFSGRWFLFVPSAMSSSFSIPWITGLIALLYLSLAAVCAVRLLGIRRRAAVVAASIAMATFPTVSYTLCYMFTADAYFFALLLSCLGAYLSDRYRWGFLAGGLCVGLSLGTYQAYVFFGVGLMALRLATLALFDAADWKQTLVRMGRFAAALAIGAAVYKIGLEASLRLRDMTLKTYMGLDGMQSFAVSDIIARIPEAYRGYFALFTGKTELLDGKLTAFGFAAVNLAAGALAALGLACAARKKGRGAIWRGALVLACLAALPAIANGIALVSTAGLHPLMQYPASLVYLLAIALYDGLAGAQADTVNAGSQARALLGYALSLCLAVSAFCWTLDANQTYLALQLKLDNMMSLATRMVDRVEQLPEYVPNVTPVWYTGTLSDANYGAIKSDVFARASATDMTGREWNYTFLMNNLYFSAFVNAYIGVTFVEPEPEQVDRALASAAYRAMPYFPGAGSVACVEGVIIVNGGPNPQSPP